MSEEIKEPTGEETPEVEETAVENEAAEETKTEKKAKKKKEKGYTFTREQVEQMELAAKQLESTKDQFVRLTAEYENYRRRTTSQAAQRSADGRNDVVASLFPVGDNLARAIAVCSDENTKKGLEMVLQSFYKVLENEGVEEINPIGQPFDASVAEAIMAMPAQDGEESGIVKMVHEKGYKKGDKILRYAKVIVTQ